MEEYSIIISGRVQGVFYRKFVSQALMRIGIQGYVRNLSDGTVEMVARIYDDEYDQVMLVLREGSPSSHVEKIDISVIDAGDFACDGFEIRR